MPDASPKHGLCRPAGAPARAGLRHRQGPAGHPSLWTGRACPGPGREAPPPAPLVPRRMAQGWPQRQQGVPGRGLCPAAQGLRGCGRPCRQGRGPAGAGCPGSRTASQAWGQRGGEGPAEPPPQSPRRARVCIHTHASIRAQKHTRASLHRRWCHKAPCLRGGWPNRDPCGCQSSCLQARGYPRAGPWVTRAPPIPGHPPTQQTAPRPVSLVLCSPRPVLELCVCAWRSPRPSPCGRSRGAAGLPHSPARATGAAAGAPGSVGPGLGRGAGVGLLRGPGAAPRAGLTAPGMGPCVARWGATPAWGTRDRARGLWLHPHCQPGPPRLSLPRQLLLDPRALCWRVMTPLSLPDPPSQDPNDPRREKRRRPGSALAPRADGATPRKSKAPGLCLSFPALEARSSCPVSNCPVPAAHPAGKLAAGSGELQPFLCLLGSAKTPEIREPGGAGVGQMAPCPGDTTVPRQLPEPRERAGGRGMGQE